MATFIPFYCAENLTAPTIRELCPWEFRNEETKALLQAMPKVKRRQSLLVPATKWNCYSVFRGFNRAARISGTNQAQGMSGLAADYDSVQPLPVVLSLIGEMAPALQPNFIEWSLSGKIRLVWVFARELNVMSNAHAIATLETFTRKMGLENLLAGYDKASLKPTEMWTNGGMWYMLRPDPMSWDYVFGMACEVNKQKSLFAHGDVPLTEIAKEVEARHPGRWQGEFELDKIGVRFWDDAADNETGCQVKPDGMLCFTGNQSFVRWSDIFGLSWVEEKKTLNLGRIADGYYFDGRSYWEQRGSVWSPSLRVDVMNSLTGMGLSSTKAKGQTQSDADRVLEHINKQNYIIGAAPLVTYPKGIVEVAGRRLLEHRKFEPCPAGERPGWNCPRFPVHLEAYLKDVQTFRADAGGAPFTLAEDCLRQRPEPPQ